MIKLKVESLGFAIANKKILSDVCLEIVEGEFVGLVGPNGCGKSTLLKNIYKVYKPDNGCVYIDGKDVTKLSNRETAKKMSVMVQENSVEFDMDVMEMVLLGRYAHKKFLSDSSAEDLKITVNALQAVGMEGYKDRSYISLSGGEKQRVLIARALAQQANLIILDEPTNHLDVGYQYQIMSILKKQKTTVFSSIHDLNLAVFYCDKIIVMDKGEIIGFGKPEEALSEELIAGLFGVSSEIATNKSTGKLQIYFYPNV